MPSIITRTAYGSSLQSCQFPGIPFTLLPNTTLNEALGIQQGVAPASGDTPEVKYWAIGNGGHSFSVGSGSSPIPLIKSLPHDPRDAGLYNQLPFVCRPIGSDLTTQQQAIYALRKILTINSQQYAAYYLRRLDLSATVVNLLLQTVNNGTTSSTAFVPGPANLHPTPPTLTNSGSNDLTSTFVNTEALVPISLSQADCTELMNAATIIYGDPAYAIISEIALCAGVDKSVALGGGTQFNEAIAVQIVAHIAAFHSIPQTPTGLNGSLNLGASDPATTQS